MSDNMYLARVRESAGKSDFSEARLLVGKRVTILPETRKFIPQLETLQFRVIPVESTNQNMDVDIRFCARHLEPLNEKTRLLLEDRLPGLQKICGNAEI